MNPKDRIDELNRAIEAIRSGWPFFIAAINERLAKNTHDLINAESEQTRGRIKELQHLTGLFDSLTSERDGISAEISDTDSAN